MTDATKGAWSRLKRYFDPYYGHGPKRFFECDRWRDHKSMESRFCPECGEPLGKGYRAAVARKRVRAFLHGLVMPALWVIAGAFAIGVLMLVIKLATFVGGTLRQWWVGG